MELIEVGGRKIAYWRVGGGHPLGLLHGAWSDGREWRPQLEGLPDEFDVIAWDARTTSARSLDTARSPPPCAT